MKRTTKSLIALLVLVAMCVSFCVPTFAEVTEGEHGHEVDNTVYTCPGPDGEHTKAILTNLEVGYKKVGEPTPSKCGQQGYTTYQCDECGKYFADDWQPKPEDHEVVVDTEKSYPATCIKAGYSYKYCAKCDEVLEDKELPKLGHDLKVEVVGKPCTDEGAKEITTCSRCDYSSEKKLEPVDHAWKITAILEKPGCGSDAKGKATATCSVCGATKTVEVDPTNADHNYKVTEVITPATCNTPGVAKAACEYCGATKDDYAIPATGEHDYSVKVEAKAPTCTEDGWTAGVKCKHCGEADPKNASKVEPKLGHKDSVISSIPATCSAAGSETVKCSVCGREETVAKEQLPHSFGEEPTFSDPASCTKYGYYFYGCTVCGYKTDLVQVAPYNHVDPKTGKPATKDVVTLEPGCVTTGTKNVVCALCDVVLSENVEIAAKGHKNETVTVAATCATEGYKYDKCTVCGTESEPYDKTGSFDPENHAWVTVDSTPATCEEDGVLLKYCPNCSEYHSEPIPAGHKWENVGDPTEPDCNNPSTQKQECKVCGETKSVVLGDPNGHDMQPGTPVAPTCTTKGYTVYTCTGCGITDTRDYKDTTPHNWTEYTEVYPTCQNDAGYVHRECQDCDATEKHNTNVAFDINNLAHHIAGKTERKGAFREATCKKLGIDEYYCSACEKSFHVTLDTKLGCENYKSNVTDPKAPTCTEPGYTEGYTCSSCGESYGKDPVPATGHTVVVDAAVAATCTTTGLTEGKHCSVCNTVLTKQKTVKALGHAKVADAAVAPTCTETGLTAGEHCSRCDYKVAQEVVPALNHKNIQKVQTVAPTCTTEGFDYYICPDCGMEYATNYVDMYGHTMVLKTVVAATCLENGYELYVCATKVGDYTCDCTETKELVAVGYHVDNDKVLEDSCMNTTDGDRKCDACGEVVGQKHNKVRTTVAATCTNYSYVLDVCIDCHEDWLIEEGKTLGGHSYAADGSDWFVKDPAGVLVEGVERRECANGCGDFQERAIPALPGVEFDYAIENVNKNSSVIANSSTIKVTIYTTASQIKLASVYLQLKYNSEILQFVGGEVVNTQFNLSSAMIKGNDNSGLASIHVSTPNKADVDFDGENVVFAVLTFKVSNTVAAGTEITLDVVESGETVSSISNAAADTVAADFGTVPTVTTVKLGSLAGKSALGSEDAQIVSNIADARDYDVAADIDGDGFVDLFDYGLLLDYLVSGMTYDEFFESEHLAEVIAERKAQNQGE